MLDAELWTQGTEQAAMVLEEEKVTVGAIACSHASDLGQPSPTTRDRRGGGSGRGMRWGMKKPVMQQC